MADPLHEFTRVDYGDPHYDRRHAILGAHPEIRELFGYDRRTAYVTVAVVVALVALAYGVERLVTTTEASCGALLVIAFGVGAVLSHWLGMSIHECSHRLAARTVLGNRLVSLFANIPMLVPAAMSFHRYHIDHHNYLGVDDADTDLAQRFEFALIGTSPWRKLLVLLLFPLLYLFRGVRFAKSPDRWELLNAFTQVVACIALYQIVGPNGMLFLLASFWLGHGIHPVAAHFVHEHYIFAPEKGQETYSYYGVLNWFTFNVGYHVEHHDLMNIPGWRLPELRRRLAPYYDGLVSHRSWTRILVRYVLDRNIGPFTRIVRSSDVRLSQRTARRR